MGNLFYSYQCLFGWLFFFFFFFFSSSVWLVLFLISSVSVRFSAPAFPSPGGMRVVVRVTTLEKYCCIGMLIEIIASVYRYI
ncbi:hypothetical protein P170DRAFT_57220 [Aspergillus steynii IBT 23096]|uniref:Uncharacterized protein n=1 Tax=Aspergillus steynii IBT 23096 TaxID=1392250 RepID=A0A2I2FSG8_9EURO|nr:uncharacterized protein P170DRAFT_57220 [Aspergillus steynii IBT 23096]PLB43585.1 hypothetical protein P170DRAFT_57220 [Aspergillus steynii IBT 23096]